MDRFFWGSTDSKQKYHWTNWSKIAKPTSEGGLNIRSFSDIQAAFHLKSWWAWREGSFFWA
ncbi:unnamed protein product [Cuscuta epithymum]|uniref:Uncharacterized protein n=1 Tax=Cuscuta epithymum TaxID=186058 RepID=A0AAV0DCS9_9ASTE|nr:unnamed protein product [Cuscuta epithymum]